MAKRYSAAQARARLRHSVNRYNQSVRNYNRKRRLAIQRYNQRLRELERKLNQL